MIYKCECPNCGFEFTLATNDTEKINDHVREITIIAQDQRIRYLEERLEELKKQLAEQLLPCPHCGGKAIWWETEDETYPHQIVCRECNCGTDECGDRQDAPSTSLSHLQSSACET